MKLDWKPRRGLGTLRLWFILNMVFPQLIVGATFRRQEVASTNYVYLKTFVIPRTYQQNVLEERYDCTIYYNRSINYLTYKPYIRTRPKLPTKTGNFEVQTGVETNNNIGNNKKDSITTTALTTCRRLLAHHIYYTIYSYNFLYFSLNVWKILQMKKNIGLVVVQ